MQNTVKFFIFIVVAFIYINVVMKFLLERFTDLYIRFIILIVSLIIFAAFSFFLGSCALT